MTFDLDTVDRLLTTTKAVRKRLDLDRPVPHEVLLECIRLGCYAPNASNAQRWRWVVVDDREQLASIGAWYRQHITPPMTKLLEERLANGDDAGVRHSRSVLYLGELFDRVPAVVLPCVPGKVEDNPTLNGASWLLGSIYPAVWGFQLALRSRGLGSTFTTAHVLFDREVHELLSIPDEYTITSMIPCGYTKGTDFSPAPRRPVEEVVSFNGWAQ